jgi:HEPN domain-containing protein/predicted nucleotidyltransferase
MTDQATRPALDLAAIAARVPAAPPGVPTHRDEIAALVAAIVARFAPARVILFGSRARGTPRPDSDVDLMVVVDPPVTRDEVVALAHAHHLPAGAWIQVHLRTPAQIRRGQAEGNFFIEDVVGDGIALYAGDGMDEMDDRDALPGDATDRAEGRPKEATRDWLDKADGDADSARVLAQSANPRWNVICFLAQQSAEKDVKALLQEHGVRFPRTHDLVALAALAAPLVPDLARLEPELDDLNECAVAVRYPEVDADRAKAERALRTMATVRALVRAALGLPADEAPS